MKKIRILLFIFFVLALILLIYSQSGAKRSKQVEEEFHTLIKDKNTSAIELASITDFAWDEAYLFGPYTSEGSMSVAMGVKFRDKSDLDYRDDIYLLVFKYDGKATKYAEIKRPGYEFRIDGDFVTPEASQIHIFRYE